MHALRSPAAQALRRPIFLILLLFFSLLSPFGLRYYGLGREIDLISILSLLALCLSIAMSNRTERKLAENIVHITILVIVMSMIYAATFVANSDSDNFILSFLSARWHLYWLLFPCTVALAERGVTLNQILLIYTSALAVCLLFFVYRQETWDLEMMAKLAAEEGSSVPIRAADDFRGFRLPDPIYAINTLAIFTTVFMFAGRRHFMVGIPFLLLLAATYFESYQRLTFVYILLAFAVTLIASTKVSTPSKFLLGLSTAFVGVTGILYFNEELFTAIGSDRSGFVRLNTILICLEQIQSHPLLGYGIDSVQGVSFQFLFGRHFVPQDVGYIGVFFEFGLLGLTLTFLVLWKLIFGLLSLERVFYTRIRNPALFASIWTGFYLLISGITFYPIGIPDGIVVFALLFAIMDIMHKDAVKKGERGLRSFGQFPRGI